MGRTVNSYVNVQPRMSTVTQSQGDVPVCLATMETAVISVSVFPVLVVIYRGDADKLVITPNAKEQMSIHGSNL